MISVMLVLSLLSPAILSPAAVASAGNIVRRASSDGPVARIDLILPSDAVAGQPVRAVIRSVDGDGRVTVRLPGRISFSSTDDDADLSAMPSEMRENVMTLEHAIVFNTPGIHYVISEDRARGIRSVSNPVRVAEKEPRYRLYWGELHAQTWYSDGWYTSVATNPDEAYQYYRYVAGLDFAAVTDHDCCWEGVLQTPFGIIGNWFTDDFMKSYGWDREKEAVKKNYDEGKFVTLLAQEWTQDYEAYNIHGDGHYNVYYDCVDEPEFYSCLDATTNRVYKMFDVLKGWKNETGRDVLMIPHHLQHPTLGWSYQYYDEELVPLVEICQTRGSSEMRNDLGNPVKFAGPMREPGHTVQDALAMGYMMGFMASTDDHAIGETAPSHVCLTGVMAENLTRDGIFDALKDRRCIAVSGAGTRMIIDFTVNNHTVGDGSVVKLDSASTPREIACTVAGTAPLSRVALVKNNETVFEVKIDGDAEDLSTYRTEFSFTDREPVRGISWSAGDYSQFVGSTKGKDYYYIRVVQSDGRAGWMGPIWVEAGL